MFLTSNRTQSVANTRPRHQHLLHYHLTLTDDARSYHLGAELAQVYTDKGILETSDGDFDFYGYARAGHCVLNIGDETYPQVMYTWERDTQQVERTVNNGWLTVTWREHALDLLTVRDPAASGHTTWIIADSFAVAEAFFRAVCTWSTEVRDEVLVFEDGYWRKDEALFTAIRAASWEDLILPSALKQQIQSDLVGFFAAQEMYRQYGIPWKRGVVLIGPPGNGKTHAVKAITQLLGKPCLYVKSIDSNRRHEHGNMRQIFERARSLAPCLLVLEDLDTLMTANNRSYVLNELDGFSGNDGILTLATTNYPEKLDPAILDRPSRFDRKYHFGLPAEAERLAYLERWNARLMPELRLSATGVQTAAAHTSDFSFAYLKELMISATMAWVKEAQPGTMDSVIVEQVALLRTQMATLVVPADDDDD